MKEKNAVISRERRAEMLAEKGRFDARARRAWCSRCHARGGANQRVMIKVSTPVGILPHSFWLCRGCGAAHLAFIREIRAAEFEADRPRREAGASERRRALSDTLAANRAQLDRDRAASGRPPLPGPKPSIPSKPKKKPAGRPGRANGGVSADEKVEGGPASD